MFIKRVFFWVSILLCVVLGVFVMALLSFFFWHKKGLHNPQTFYDYLVTFWRALYHLWLFMWAVWAAIEKTYDPVNYATALWASYLMKFTIVFKHIRLNLNWFLQKMSELQKYAINGLNETFWNFTYREVFQWISRGIRRKLFWLQLYVVYFFYGVKLWFDESIDFTKFSEDKKYKLIQRDPLYLRGTLLLFCIQAAIFLLVVLFLCFVVFVDFELAYLIIHEVDKTSPVLKELKFFEKFSLSNLDKCFSKFLFIINGSFDFVIYFYFKVEEALNLSDLTHRPIVSFWAVTDNFSFSLFVRLNVILFYFFATLSFFLFLKHTIMQFIFWGHMNRSDVEWVMSGWKKEDEWTQYTCHTEENIERPTLAPCSQLFLAYLTVLCSFILFLGVLFLLWLSFFCSTQMCALTQEEIGCIFSEITVHISEEDVKTLTCELTTFIPRILEKHFWFIDIMSSEMLYSFHKDVDNTLTIITLKTRLAFEEIFELQSILKNTTGQMFTNDGTTPNNEDFLD